jgi:hypothetical protein
MGLIQLADVFESIAGSCAALSGAFHGFSQTAGSIAVTALWQGIVVAAGLAICFKLVPRISVGHRFALWALGFIVLVGLPFLPMLLSLSGAGVAPGESSGLGSISSGPWFQLDSHWSLALAALWVIASLIRAVDLAILSLRLRTLWRNAVPVEAGFGLNSSLAGTSGLSQLRRIQICTTKELDRPSVIGFFAPRILIPDWLFERLTPDELDQVILHEAEHIRRRDDWTNLFQKLCLVLFPLNPGLWWIERQLCKQREMACDEGVVRITHAPRAYAACLASLAERGLRHRAEALTLGAWQRRPELFHRVHSLLRRNRALHPAASGAVLAALCCGLFAVSFEFARCPQLVAFVPKQSARTQARASGRRQAEPARLVNAAYTPVRASYADRSSFYAMQTKAALPGASSRPRVVCAAKQRSLSKAIATEELQASSAERAGNLAREQLVAAHLDAPKATLPHEQQLIVFAMWEQVGTSNIHAEQESDFDNSPSSISDSDPAGSQPNSTVTVTQLILRVIPAGSKSTQPAPVPFRSGWIVFQL